MMTHRSIGPSWNPIVTRHRLIKRAAEPDSWIHGRPGQHLSSCSTTRSRAGQPAFDLSVLCKVLIGKVASYDNKTSHIDLLWRTLLNTVWIATVGCHKWHSINSHLTQLVENKAVSCHIVGRKKQKISHSNNLIDRGSRYRGGTTLYYISLNTWIWKYKTMVAASSTCLQLFLAELLWINFGSGFKEQGTAVVGTSRVLVASKHTTQFRMDRAGLKNREIRVKGCFQEFWGNPTIQHHFR